jgi:hypothetical protein
MKKIIFIFFLSFRLLAYSQEESLFSNSDYFETMRNKLNLKFELDNDLETFEFDNDGISYSVKPNTDLRMSVALNHKFLSIKLGFSPKFLTGNPDLKGNTSVFKFNMDFFFLKKWVQTFEVSNVKGYYIEDITDYEDLNNNLEIDYFLLPNMQTKIFRGITRYNFNKDFSIKAMLNKSEIQRKNAGSFVPSYTYEYFKLTEPDSFYKLESVNFILNAGYFYTLVLDRKWYANIGASPGIGLGFNKLRMEQEKDDHSEWSSDFIFDMRGFIDLGYNSKFFFGGISFSGIGTTRSDTSVIKFDSVRSVFKVFIGYRFKAPKFVNKSFDWIENVNPLK